MLASPASSSEPAGSNPLPVTVARLISGDLTNLLQMHLHPPRDDFVDPKVGGHAIDLVQELLAGFVVIDLVGAGDGLIPIEPIERLEVERLEIRRDRRDIARRDGLGPKLHSGGKAGRCRRYRREPDSTL
jgi:hypothetical protein